MIKKVKSLEVFEKFIIQNRDLFPDSLKRITNVSEYVKKILGRGVAYISFSDNNEPRALIGGYMNDTDTATAYVSILVTKEEYSGKGIASELISRFEKDAQESGMTRVQLNVIIGNKKAEKFYVKNGYVVLSKTGNRNVLIKDIL